MDISLLTESGLASFVRRLSEKHPDAEVKSACAELFRKWKESRGGGIAAAAAAKSRGGSSSGGGGSSGDSAEDRSVKLAQLLKKLASTADAGKQKEIAKILCVRPLCVQPRATKEALVVL